MFSKVQDIIWARKEEENQENYRKIDELDE